MTEDIPNIDVVKKILKLLDKGEDMIEYVKDRPGHDRRYAVDWSKIKNELGWEPQHNFEEWLVKTVDWYKNNRQWWEHIKSGEYKEYYAQQYGK
jgi:dTDP-glucose 4,6-dehydratase